METHSKTAFFRKAAAAAGMTAAVLMGSLFPEANKTFGDMNDVNTNTGIKSSVTSSTANFITYRKAGLDEYQVPVAVTANPSTETAEETAQETAAETETASETAAPSSSSAAASVTAPFKATSESFSVAAPANQTKAVDVTPAKLGLSNTRSVANEYYTVNDIRTGKKVTMNAHELVCRMVYSEIGASWNEEAIKAQAVAAYTNLRFNDALGKIPTVGMIANYPAKLENAVKAVEGQCVYYNGGIINSSYFASAAGYTADCYDVTGISYPYLKSVVSAYDAQDPNYGIVTRFSAAQVKSKLEAKLGFKLSDDVKNWFSIGAVHSGKYVKTLVIDGGKATMSGEAARWLFGLKSAAFEITYSGGMFCFKTYGYGHGVGMSQWGAKLYADHGYTYDQILRHYYVNTDLKVSEPSVKAMKRGNMSTAEIEKEIKTSSVAAPDKYGSDPSKDIVVDQEAVKNAEKEAAEKAAKEAEEAAKKEVSEGGENTDAQGDTAQQTADNEAEETN